MEMNKLPEVVVLAGGVGKRFKDHNSKSPDKPLIEVCGASQIAWAILGALSSYPRSRIYIASRSELVEPLRIEIESRFPGLVTEYVDVGAATRGAAHTLNLFIENSRMLNRESQIISCDNDCLSFISQPIETNFVSVMHSDNPGHCFVSTSDDGYVRMLNEKIVVGSLALSGHYGFSSSKSYLDSYNETDFIDGEYFLSKVVGQAVVNLNSFSAVVCEQYLSLGTPAEIQRLNPDVIDFQSYKMGVSKSENA